MNNAIGALVSSIIGKSAAPAVIQFGWDGGILYDSLKKAFGSFELDVVPDPGHTEEDEEGAPEDIVFCDPDLLGSSPGGGYDVAVIDPCFECLSLAIYMSVEGVVSENGYIVIPDGDRIPRCRNLLHEMVVEGTTKCVGGSHGRVRIYEVHNNKMVEML